MIFFIFFVFFFFFFKQKTAYEIRLSLVGSEMCIRDRRLLELGTMALLDYVESCPDGFRILVRDRRDGETGGSYGSILADIITRVEGLLAAVFSHRGLDPKAAPLYAQALTGMVSMTGQWWLDNPQLSKAEVATHLVNLAWNLSLIHIS